MIVEQATATPGVDGGGQVAWRKIVAKYQQPSTVRASWQVANTFIPYALLWGLMYLSLGVSWWVTIPLAMLAASVAALTAFSASADQAGSGGNTPQFRVIPANAPGHLATDNGPRLITSGAGNTRCITAPLEIWTGAARAMCGP